jgi:hypothetical protein
MVFDMNAPDFATLEVELITCIAARAIPLASWEGRAAYQNRLSAGPDPGGHPPPPVAHYRVKFLFPLQHIIGLYLSLPYSKKPTCFFFGQIFPSLPYSAPKS